MRCNFDNGTAGQTKPSRRPWRTLISPMRYPDNGPRGLNLGQSQTGKLPLGRTSRVFPPIIKASFTRYNLVALKFLWLTASLPLLFCAASFAQGPAIAGQTVLVVPFENQSKAPGIEWIGESFPELLQERLNSSTLFVLPREDRLRAYDRVGIPIALRPSRATLYRMAEQMDVDYVVLGEYSFDGRIFSIGPSAGHAPPRLLPEMIESGPLLQLIDIQTGLAWDILQPFTRTFPSAGRHLSPPRLPSAWMLSKIMFGESLRPPPRNRFNTSAKPFV